jgi:bifunctional DNase/RNase
LAFRLALRPAAFCLALAALAGCHAKLAAPTNEVAVDVDRVALDRSSGSPVVVLEDHAGKRSLPIWIGFAEAGSIASELRHEHPPRPNTHDLAKRLLDDLHGAVSRVVVTELREGTFYAVLVLETAGRKIEVDARPSDAIALALRTGAPVFVRESLFEAAQGDSTPPAADEHST